MKQSAAVPAEQGPGGSALDADGYLVVPTGLPRPFLQAVVDDIWSHAGATPGDPATWYQPAIIRPRPGMVEMYHYQSMWDVRQHPAVYGIFRDLHRTDELWVSIDRVALKPPVRADRPDYDQPGFIHWDTDINRYPTSPSGCKGFSRWRTPPLIWAASSASPPFTATSSASWTNGPRLARSPGPPT